MTTEQLIVFGIIGAAFIAGWIASLVIRRRGRVPPPAQAQIAAQPDAEPGTEDARAESPVLTVEVGEALQSDAANERMLSVMRGDNGPGLSELELDLADWGFTYGVAWARAREREPRGPDEAIASEALEAAEKVFRAYTGGDDWTDAAVRERSNGKP